MCPVSAWPVAASSFAWARFADLGPSANRCDHVATSPEAACDEDHRSPLSRLLTSVEAPLRRHCEPGKVAAPRPRSWSPDTGSTSRRTSCVLSARALGMTCGGPPTAPSNSWTNPIAGPIRRRVCSSCPEGPPSRRKIDWALHSGSTGGTVPLGVLLFGERRPPSKPTRIAQVTPRRSDAERAPVVA